MTFVGSHGLADPTAECRVRTEAVDNVEYHLAQVLGHIGVGSPQSNSSCGNRPWLPARPQVTPQTCVHLPLLTHTEGRICPAPPCDTQMPLTLVLTTESALPSTAEPHLLLNPDCSLLPPNHCRPRTVL